MRSARQIRYLHHFKSLVHAFFPALKNSVNISTCERTNTSILIFISGTDQYQLTTLENQYIGQALQNNTRRQQIKGSEVAGCSQLNIRPLIFNLQASRSVFVYHETCEKLSAKWQIHLRGPASSVDTS